ncbi:MAG TPA: hypothetical protein VJA40_04575 [archaeon]|nr:hypothetical protein [archaeon]
MQAKTLNIVRIVSIVKIYRAYNWCSGNMVELAVKRIPVSEKVWMELGDMKRAGQTYDELVKSLIKEYKQKALGDMVKKARNTRFVKVDTSKW